MANNTPLSDSEKDEMKALQDMRKLAGEAGKDRVQFTDSQRIRLSELQNRAGESKASTSTTSTSTSTGSSSSSSGTFGTSTKK